MQNITCQKNFSFENTYKFFTISRFAIISKSKTYFLHLSWKPHDHKENKAKSWRRLACCWVFTFQSAFLALHSLCRGFAFTFLPLSNDTEKYWNFPINVHMLYFIRLSESLPRFSSNLIAKVYTSKFMTCFIYILDSSFPSSFKFWSSKFPSSSICS